MPQNTPSPLCGVATGPIFSLLQLPKGSPDANIYIQDVPGEALVTTGQPRGPLQAATKSPKVPENRADSPYLTEDEPLDEEEQDSRHGARKKG